MKIGSCLLYLKTSILLLSCLSWLNSCSEEGTSLEPIDIKTSSEFTKIYPEFVGKHLIEVMQLHPANIHLITEISSRPIDNGFDIPPETFTTPIAFFDCPSKVKEVKFNGELLKETSTILPLPRFVVPDNWDNTIFSYSEEYMWSFKYENLDVLSYQYSFCDNLHKVYLSCGDSLLVNNTYTLSWNPSDEVDELWMDFIWTPANSSPKLINGIKLDDNGKYSISGGDFHSYGINSKGVLTICLIRLKNELHNLTNGSILTNITFSEARVYVNVYTQ